METEEERQARRRARLEEMKREKRRRELLYKWGIPVMAGMAIVVGIGIGFGAAAWTHKDNGRGGALQESQEAHRTGEDSEDKADRGGNGTGEDSEDKADRGGEDSQDGLTADNQKTQGADSAQRRKSRHAAGGTVMAAGEAYAPRLRFPSQEPGQTEAAQQTAEPEPVPTPEPLGGAIPPQNAVFGMTEATAGFSETILSEYGVFIDAQSGEILAQKKPGALVSPASMTKILTILTAADHIGGLNGTYVITQEMVDYCRSNGCSTAGFLPGEEVSLTDLFYGTILPSGADAALALACYVAGSQEAFVELMNQKARELGLSSSARFANCIGLYDPDNVCTVYDMAMILWAAMENNVCRTFLTERNRVLPPNGVREEELDLSNWFIRRIEDHMPEGLAVLGAKTGYVSMAGSCAASFAQSRDGREYICVTAKASGGWQCIFDQAAIYAAWAGR